MKSLAILLSLTAFAAPGMAQVPGFKLDGEKWAYTSGDRSFVGYLVKPAGRGPFPAVIINHGKGGRPDQFSLNWAREMATWGLVGICPTLTHVAGTDIEGKDGASEENIARDGECLAILASLGYVDMTRVAVCGHSMGGFITIGYCGTAGAKVRAAAISAGGVTEREGFAMPSVASASGITAPMLMLHGTIDQAVGFETSALLQHTLTKKNVPTRRVAFVGMDHGMPTNPATRPVVLSLIREWFGEHGVLDVGKNSPPTLTPPPDATVAAAATPSPFKFTVGDRETNADALAVTAASSNPKVLPPANLTLAGSGAERTISAKPIEAGPATIFLTVSDGARVTTKSFVLSFSDSSGNVPKPVIQRFPPGGRDKSGRGGLPNAPRPPRSD